MKNMVLGQVVSEILYGVQMVVVGFLYLGVR